MSEKDVPEKTGNLTREYESFEPLFLFEDRSLGCFVCCNDRESSIGLKARIEDEASARIICMFNGGFQLLYKNGYRSRAIIGVCHEHMGHLKVLQKLIDHDDQISAYRVIRAQHALTRDKFIVQVRYAAHHYWCTREHQRSVSNWCDAGKQLYQELGRLIKREELEQRARELWLKRKDAEAYQDWEAGEKWVREIWEVID